MWQSVEQDADGNWVGVEPAIFAATGEPAVITTNADTGYVLSAAIQHSNIDPTSPHYQKLYLIETSYPKGYFTHEQLGTENLVTVDCSTGGPTYHLDIGNIQMTLLQSNRKGCGNNKGPPLSKYPSRN